MLRYIIILIFQLNFVTCISCQNKDGELDKIKVNINYTVINQDSTTEKKIIKTWEDYLNSGEESYLNSKSLSYWLTSSEFPVPNHFLLNIGKNKNEIKNINKSRVSVIALYSIAKDTFALKTMFCYYKDSSKLLMLDNICTIYAINLNGNIKFISHPQLISTKWNKEKTSTVQFYYPKGHNFNKFKAMKLDSFNNQIAKLFRTKPLEFKYFVCENNVNVHEIVGYQFTPNQYVPNQVGALCSSANKAIFSGNGSEYYPHEIIHLYTAQFWGKEGHYYHSWFDEGIATLFGGSRDKDLEWHLEKLKSYLEQNPQETLMDISKLSTIPNGEFMTEFNYAIGGLICKRIYEAKGMDGIFDLLKSGSTDEDFYKTIERHFGVKKAGFSKFIREELNKN